MTRTPFSLTEWESDPNKVKQNQIVKTGLGTNDCVDRMAGGGHGRGELMVIGGGTGHGKSYLAIDMLKQQGRLKQRALLLSAEDPHELYWCRALSTFTESRLSPAAIRQRTADPELVEEAKQRMRESFQDTVYVEVIKKPTISEVCAAIREYRYVKDIDLVIVDYLQAIRADADEPGRNKVDEVSSFVSALKRCCDSVGVALVLLSQYARDEYRDGTEPSLNSCKYAGDIENEAELMVLLWKDSENVLRAKIPKVKWASARDRRYVIDICDVTGSHQQWNEEQPQQ